MRVFAYFLRVQKVGRPGGETPKSRGLAGTRRQKGTQFGARRIPPPAGGGKKKRKVR